LSLRHPRRPPVPGAAGPSPGGSAHLARTARWFRAGRPAARRRAWG